MASGEPLQPLAVGVGATPLNLGILAIFALAMLVVVRQESKANRSASDYYVAGRSFTGPQNGVALAGDFLSAVLILGISGSIAVYGYDGFLYALGAPAGWLAALLVAESIRNVGRFTMGDVLSVRLRERPGRAAAARASTNFPTILFSLFWKRFSTAGALWSIYTGLFSSVLLIVLSPAVCRRFHCLAGVSGRDQPSTACGVWRRRRVPRYGCGPVQSSPGFFVGAVGS